MFKSLKSKIIVPLIALLIVLVLVVVTVASVSIRNLSDTLTDKRIHGISQAVITHLESLEQQSLIAAHAMVNSSVFRSYVQDENREALLVYLNSRRELFDIDNFVVTDNLGYVIIRTHTYLDYGDSITDFPGILDAMQGASVTIYSSNPITPLALTTATPIQNAEDEIIGVLVAIVDMATDAFADEFAYTFSAEVAFYSGNTVVSTTIEDRYGVRRVGGLASDEVIMAVLGEALVYSFVLELYDVEHRALYFPLYAQPNETPSGMFFVAFSNADTIDATSDMQRLLLFIGIVIVILGSFLMLLLLIRLLRPLAKLNQSVSQIADPAAFDLHIYGSERSDEVGVLSRTIEHMCDTIRANAIIEHKMTKELKVALDKAQAASTAKSNFLSNMSHEIRTPINAITGMVAIGKSSASSDKKDYALEKIDGACEHLLRIVNDILDMSKIEANKFELSNSNFKFSHLITRVVDINIFNANEKNQKLSLNISKDIPEELVGDEYRLVQVLTNLMSNAVKFTPENGKISLEAKLFEMAQNGTDEAVTILFEVIDSGIGISEEQKGRLFKAFEQAENSTSRRFGGTGLGLTISKHIVELMGGKIWVESQPGEGSKFSFTVPLMQSTSIPPSEVSLASDDVAAVKFGNRNVLLCEDIDLNREIVEILLSGFGLKIDHAENGIEAIEKFSANPDKYDIILMDLQMPLMDGLEATRQIRKLPLERAGTIPIVAMTANVFKEDVEQCIDAGMNDHIGKPIDIDMLIKTLKKYIG